MTKNKRTEGVIKAHYGMKDYFNYFKKNNPILSYINKKLYNSIISDFNQALVDLIIEENLTYTVPYLGSSLNIRKEKKVPRIVNGKLYNTTPVDWVATNKLWDEDIEAKEKKLLVRYSNSHTSRYVFRIYLKKYNYSFKNKKYYSFKPCRTFQRLLSKRIKDESKSKYDTYLLY